MKIEYAILPKRVKAAFIDTILIIGLIFLASETLALFKNVPNYIRIIVFVCFLLFKTQYLQVYMEAQSDILKWELVYEMLSTQKRKLTLLVHYLDSFLIIYGNEKRQAIHDLIGNSIVIEDEK